MKNALLIFTFIVIIFGVISITFYITSLPEASSSDDLSEISVNINSQQNSKISRVVCSDDVQLCEDGGYVSRDPSNSCKFDCSQAYTPVSGVIYCPQDLKQCANGNFVIRDPNNRCNFKSCEVRGLQSE